MTESQCNEIIQQATMIYNFIFVEKNIKKAREFNKNNIIIDFDRLCLAFELIDVYNKGILLDK